MEPTLRRGDAYNIGSQLTRLLGDGGRQPGEVNYETEGSVAAFSR
jgi:hypothetical protein